MAPGCDSAYIRNVRRHPSAVPKLYRLYDAHAFISHAFPLGQTDPFASFLPLFRRIGSKNVKNDLRIQLSTMFFFQEALLASCFFFFFERKFKFWRWRVWIIASLLQSVQWHKNSFEIPVHAVHYVAQTWTLGDVTAWQTRVARAARVTSIRVFLMPSALSNVLLKL